MIDSPILGVLAILGIAYVVITIGAAVCAAAIVATASHPLMTPTKAREIEPAPRPTFGRRVRRVHFGRRQS